MQLPKVIDPSHNASIEVLMCSKNVKEVNLSGNIHALLELWVQKEKNKPQGLLKMF